MLNRDPLGSPGPLIDRVYAYAAYRLGSRTLAEDVTSETLERAVRYRSSYDPRKGTPEAWIVGIARRCIADLRAVPQTEELEPEVASSEGLEQEAILRLELAGALESLEGRDRELVALRYGADLPSADIARLLGMTRGAVDVALHRALARLRDQLDPDAPEDAVRKPVVERYTQQPTPREGDRS